MKVGDNVDIFINDTRIAHEKGIGTLFSGQVLAVREKAIQVKGTSVLRRPAPDGESIPCRLCSRPLTEEASISIGYGPDCAVQLGMTNKMIRDLRRALTRDEITSAEKSLTKIIWLPRSVIEVMPLGESLVREQARRQERRVARQETVQLARQVAANMQHEEVSDAPIPGIILPPGQEPRNYQWRAARFMLDFCRANPKANPQLWDLPGVGKTCSSILFMLGSVDDLARQGRHGPCVVICPPVMVGTWKRELEAWWFGCKVQIMKGFTDEAKPKMDVYILSWAILANGFEPMRDRLGNIIYHDKKKKDKDGNISYVKAPVIDDSKVILTDTLRSVMAQHPICLVADECFPYNTEVETDQGLLPIGKIVERRLAVHVRSYDTEQATWVWKPVINWFRNRPRRDFVRIEHERGSLVCTPNHKIWTENRGYVEAGSLTGDDYLLVVWTELPGRVRSQNTTNVFEEMCDDARYDEPVSSSIGDQTTDAPCNDALRAMWSGFPPTCAQSEKGRAVLQPQMLSDLEVISTGRGRTPSSSRTDETGWGTTPFASIQGGFIAQNEATQSHMGSEGSEEDQSGQLWQDLLGSWWQRPDHSPATDVGGCTGLGQGSIGVRDTHQSSSCLCQVTPFVLHGGSCGSEDQVGDRSRWADSSDQKMEVLGPQEGAYSCISRVVRVEVHESARVGGPRDDHTGDPFVYDLTVEDTHNYVADGVLVSNCHNAKNIRAQRSMALAQLALITDRMTGLTGTPVLNRVDELISTLSASGIMEAEFGSTDAFEKEFCNKHVEWITVRGGRRRPVSQRSAPSGTKLVELHRRLIPYVIRRRTEHVIKDMPPLTIARVTVELANREEYDELEYEIAQLPPNQRFGQLARLRQLCGIGKIPAAIEWIENFLECDEKLISFSTHVAIQQALIEHFEKSNPAKILGRSQGSTDKKRQAEMDRFQQDPACLLSICASGSAREGITLTAAANVLDIELEYTPGIQDQKWKRSYRLGQTDPVTVWVLAAEDSQDDTLIEKLASKRRITGEITDAQAEVLNEQLIKEAVVRDLVARVARRKKKGKVA